VSRAGTTVLLAVALLGVAGCTSSPQATDAVAPRESPHRPAMPNGPSSPAASAEATQAVGQHLHVTQVPWRLPRAMSRGAAVPVHGGVVLAGGLLPGDVSTGQAYRITFPAGHLQRLSALGTAAHDAAGALLDGRPAVFGGGGSSELSVVQRLGADGSWHVVGRLPGARSDLSAVSYDGGVVVLGGYDGSRSPRTTRCGARALPGSCP
jgi:hypothetical protein